MTVLTVNNWKDRSDNSESYSKQCWLNDLSTLFDNANQRFADISWKSEDDDQDIVYAHKGDYSFRLYILIHLLIYFSYNLC